MYPTAAKNPYESKIKLQEYKILNLTIGKLFK